MDAGKSFKSSQNLWCASTRRSDGRFSFGRSVFRRLAFARLSFARLSSALKSANDSFALLVQSTASDLKLDLRLNLSCPGMVARLSSMIGLFTHSGRRAQFLNGLRSKASVALSLLAFSAFSVAV
jgi:hypothetical protein